MLAVVKGRCNNIVNRIFQLGNRTDAFATKYHTALIWMLGIGYKFALDALYIWAASPMYSYAGLVYFPSFIKYVISVVMYLILFSMLPKEENSTSGLLLHLQFVFTVAPMLSFYALSGASSRYMFMVFICVLLQCRIVNRPQKCHRKVYITGIDNYVTVFLGVLMILTTIVPVLYNGFEGLKAFDIKYIYTMRANATYPPGFGYILKWMDSAIIPFACLMFLNKKKYGYFSICVLVQVILYMETGSKFTLFILIPVIVIYLLANTGHLLKCLYAGFVAMCIVLIFAYQLDKHTEGLTIGTLANAIISVRAMFHPADNKFAFFECFSQNPKIYFSDGMIGKMFSLTYPYVAESGRIIMVYLGGKLEDSNLNTGYLGEAYAQMGFVGMLLMSILLGYILRALQVYNSKRMFPVLAALFSIYIIILNDGALFTTLFTGGMLVAFMLVFIYLGKQEKGEDNGI